MSEVSQPRGSYRKFDGPIKEARDLLIENAAKKVIDHVKGNADGKCKRGFVKDLIDASTIAAPALKITRGDINNKVSKMRDELAPPPEANAPSVLPSSVHPVQVERLSNAASFEESVPPSDHPNSMQTETEASALSDEDTDPPSEESETSVVARNLGGRPKGTTDVFKQWISTQWKKAVNFVVISYAEAKDAARAAGKSRVEKGLKDKIVEEAKVKFKLTDYDFDVPMQTIDSRIQNERLEVWQSGPTSLLLGMEVHLKVLILTAAKLHAAMNVTQTIALANELIRGQPVEKAFIEFKKNCGLPTSETDVLGLAWWKGFKQRNPDISLKVGLKFERNRQAHLTYDAFKLMCDNIESGLIESGNAVKYETPVLMDKEGNIVNDEKLAFGLPVTINIIHPDNVFYMDETGSNTNGKSDKRNGGEKKVVGTGTTPREIVGTRDSHFTVVPVTDGTGELRVVVIIFASKNLNADWMGGEDVFADNYDHDCYENNLGLGRRFPGLELQHDDGTDVLIVFACHPSGSMTGGILKEVFEKMDKNGITKRGSDENGVDYMPAMIFDGHGSRLDLEFVSYVTDKSHQWQCMFGVPYGTSVWQLHDDKRQNGSFKMALSRAKSSFYRKKILHGLPPEVLPCEIVVIAREAINGSFMIQDHAKKALCHRGMNPFNRNTLTHPDILWTAPDDIRTQTYELLLSRDIREIDGNPVLPPTEADLTQTGSGLLLGTRAPEVIAETLHSLNHNGTTADSIFKLAEKKVKLDEGRRTHMQTSLIPPGGSVKDVYMSRKISATAVVIHGRSVINADVREALVEKQRAKDQTATAAAAKKKKAKTNLHKEYAKIKALRAEQGDAFEWTVTQLKVAIRMKKKPRNDPNPDPKTPSNRAGLLSLWSLVERRRTPPCSPENSDDEDSVGDEQIANEEELGEGQDDSDNLE